MNRYINRILLNTGYDYYLFLKYSNQTGIRFYYNTMFPDNFYSMNQKNNQSRINLLTPMATGCIWPVNGKV